MSICIIDYNDDEILFHYKNRGEDLGHKFNVPSHGTILQVRVSTFTCMILKSGCIFESLGRALKIVNLDFTLNQLNKNFYG